MVLLLLDVVGRVTADDGDEKRRMRKYPANFAEPDRLVLYVPGELGY